MRRSALSLPTVSQIRTHTGLVGHGATPFKRYMRITSLELERSRLDGERGQLRQRLARLDERIRQIEGEKLALLAQDPARPAAAGRSPAHARRLFA